MEKQKNWLVDVQNQLGLDDDQLDQLKNDLSKMFSLKSNLFIVQGYGEGEALISCGGDENIICTSLIYDLFEMLYNLQDARKVEPVVFVDQERHSVSIAKRPNSFEVQIF